VRTRGLPNARDGSIHKPKESLDVEHDYADHFQRTLNVEGLEMFYREAGPRDAPTVLLLHGGRLPASTSTLSQNAGRVIYVSVFIVICLS